MDAHAAVRRAGEHVHRHRHVRELLLVVALDVGGLESRLPQLPVEEDARPGPALAVDEPHAGQVVDALNVQRVAVRNDEALMPNGEIDHRKIRVREKLLEEREIEVVGFRVEQVHA